MICKEHFDAGKDAREHGFKLDTNPHGPDTPEHQDWREGYLQGHFEKQASLPQKVLA